MTINGLTVTAGIEQTKVAQGSVRAEKVEVIDNATRIPTAAALDQENQQSINSDRFLKTKPEFIFYGMAVSVARHTQLHCYL